MFVLWSSCCCKKKKIPHSVKMTHPLMDESKHDMWPSTFICNRQRLNLGWGIQIAGLDIKEELNVWIILKKDQNEN